MERKIDEEFECGKVRLKVIKSSGCSGCFFNMKSGCSLTSKLKNNLTGYCSVMRDDGTSIKFEEQLN